MEPNLGLSTTKLRKRYSETNKLNKKHNIFIVLTRDQVLTVALGEWPATVNMWDGETLSGPVARLFATSPEAATKEMEGHPGNTFKDMNRLNSKFFVSENIAPEDAFAYILNPR